MFFTNFVIQEIIGFTAARRKESLRVSVEVKNGGGAG